jgi:hypothetical protein
MRNAPMTRYRAKPVPRWLKMERGNLEAANLIISDPALTPGPESLMYQWAELFLSRRNYREGIEAISGVSLRAFGLTRSRGERPLPGDFNAM